MKLPVHFYAFAVSLVGLVGIIVLAGTGHPIPNVLQEVTIAALVGGAGLAIPTGSNTP